jgi:hypothetical protein
MLHVLETQPESVLPVGEPPSDVFEEDPHPLPQHVLLSAAQTQSNLSDALKAQVQQEVVDNFLLR